MLQELIVSKYIRFYGNSGRFLGDKRNQRTSLGNRTGIPEVLSDGSRPLSEYSINERFSWANRRGTKRKEDLEYYIFGIFNVHMSLIYGMGKKRAIPRARKRLNCPGHLPFEILDPMSGSNEVTSQFLGSLREGRQSLPSSPPRHRCSGSHRLP